MAQDDINQLLIDLAGEHAAVVRLKGGDPFVFGRGGEEAEALAAAGVAFEIVPGITAGVAAPAYAGIPATHRAEASARGVRNRPRGPGQGCGRSEALDWEALAAFPGTLVFYMGVKNLPLIAEQLIAGGRAGDEPVAIDRARHAAGPAHDHGHLAADTAGRAEEAGLARAGDHDRRRGRRDSTSRSPGSNGARSTAARSSSRARGRKPARSRRASRASAPR